MCAPDDGRDVSRPDARETEDLRLAGVAHDVNQMLAVITGRAGLLRRDEPDPARRRHLQAIILAAEDATAMLRRLSRQREGAEFAGAGRSLRELAEEAGLLAWPQGTSWIWRNEVPGELAAAIPAQVVREVLVNLLLNAREVLRDGGGVTVTGGAGPPDRVVLHVADDGPGLPAEDPEAVFKIGVTGSGEDGRGVGLAACRLLLRRYGAELGAGRSPAGGAQFVMDLPTARPDGPAMEGAGGSRAGVRDFASWDVVVVDDEPVVREMLQDVLTDAGCRVRTCRDASEALAACAEAAPQVVLIDRNLPGMSGPELASQLRVADAWLAIVLMSGWQGTAEASVSGESAADFEVRKPLSFNQIHDILTEAGRLWRDRRAKHSDG